MSSISIAGDTSGSVILTVPAAAGSSTITLPAGTGTAAVQGVSTNIVSGTAQTAPPTTPQYFDFTGIPSWVKRVTVMFNGVSTNGTSLIQLQLGAGSPTTTGYNCLSQVVVNSNITGVTSYTSGCVLAMAGSAASTVYGNFVCTLITGNTWTFTFNGYDSSGSRSLMTTGSIALSGTLDRIRITTVNGTDTFDAGSINILYE